MSNGLSWNSKKLVFDYLSKNPDATPYQVVQHFIDLGYTTWAPTRGQIIYCMKVFRARTGKKEDGKKENGKKRDGKNMVRGGR